MVMSAYQRVNDDAKPAPLFLPKKLGLVSFDDSSLNEQNA